MCAACRCFVFSVLLSSSLLLTTAAEAQGSAPLLIKPTDSELDRSIEQLTARAAAAPDDARVHTDLGRALAARGKLDAAESELRRAAVLSPDNSEIHVALASVLLDAKRYEDALAQARTAERLAPRNPLVQQHLGNALAETGHFDDAVAAFRTAAELDPGDAAPPLNVGTMYLRAKRPAEAIEPLVLARAIDPWYPGVEERLTLASKQALKELEQAAVAAPQSARGRYRLAYARLFAQGRKQALDEVDRAIGVTSQAPELHEARSMILYQNGRYEDGAAAARRCLEIEAKSWWCQFDLGTALLTLGKLEPAEKAFIAADASLPNVKNVMRGRCAVALLLQRGTAAVEACRRCAQVPPVMAGDHVNLGVAYKNVGDRENAIEHARIAERAGLPQAKALLRQLGVE